MNENFYSAITTANSSVDRNSNKKQYLLEVCKLKTSTFIPKPKYLTARKKSKKISRISPRKFVKNFPTQTIIFFERKIQTTNSKNPKILIPKIRLNSAKIIRKNPAKTSVKNIKKNLQLNDKEREIFTNLKIINSNKNINNFNNNNK